jgi:HEAT repeat protein
MDTANVKEMEARKDVEGLVEALKAGGPEVRRSAAKSLGEIGDARAVESLIEALKASEQEFLSDINFDFNLQLMDIISSALGKIGEPAVSLLVSAIGDVDTSKALIRAGIAAVEPLIRCLKDANERGRGRASYALGEIKDPRAAEALIEALKDENNGVRNSAALSLGEIGNAGAVKALIEALRDENNDVRRSAAESLGEIGDPRAAAELAAAIEDENKWVRQAAQNALDEIRSKGNQG